MYYKPKTYILAFFLYLSFTIVNAQQTDPPFLKYMDHPWVDSVFNSLTPIERIGQLIWIDAYSNQDIGADVRLSNLIKETSAGGVIFFEDNAAKQADMINHFQEISKVPLLIAEDGEWGLGMRLEGITDFPYQMTLGAIRNDSLIYEMGKAVALQFKRAGIHINLAPVADVNNNQGNSVINYRSFGENPDNVARKTLMYMNGLQDNGILATAKHFPGHGDTETDSHTGLPVIKQTKARIDSIELVPFKTLINAGIPCIMPGHFNIPALDSVPGIPATFSDDILTGLLRDDLSFKGLTISDAMNMEGVSKYPAPEGAGLLALKAGMDVLEYPEDPLKTIEEIAEGIKNGIVSQEEIDNKCRRVLALKYHAGLYKNNPVNKENIREELSPVTSIALIRDLFAKALTLLRNENNIVPVKHLGKTKIATVAVNKTRITYFQQRIIQYQQPDNYYIDPADSQAVNDLVNKLT